MEGDVDPPVAALRAAAVDRLRFLLATAGQLAAEGAALRRLLARLPGVVRRAKEAAEAAASGGGGPAAEQAAHDLKDYIEGGLCPHPGRAAGPAANAVLASSERSRADACVFCVLWEYPRCCAQLLSAAAHVSTATGRQQSCDLFAADRLRCSARTARRLPNPRAAELSSARIRGRVWQHEALVAALMAQVHRLAAEARKAEAELLAIDRETAEAAASEAKRAEASGVARPARTRRDSRASRAEITSTWSGWRLNPGSASWRVTSRATYSRVSSAPSPPAVSAWSNLLTTKNRRVHRRRTSSGLRLRRRPSIAASSAVLSFV